MNREDVQTWCLDKGFELVELNPVQDDYDLGKFMYCEITETFDFHCSLVNCID